MLTGAIEGSAEVTLHKPPPLARPLVIEPATDQRIVPKDGAGSVAEARPVKFGLAVKFGCSVWSSLGF
jgi:hypothetical protein